MSGRSISHESVAMSQYSAGSERKGMPSRYDPNVMIYGYLNFHIVNEEGEESFSVDAKSTCITSKYMKDWIAKGYEAKLKKNIQWCIDHPIEADGIILDEGVEYNYYEPLDENGQKKPPLQWRIKWRTVDGTSSSKFATKW